MAKSIVPIVSGGIDSTVMLWYLVNNGYSVKEILSFNYGQKHEKEMDHACKVVKEFSNKINKVNHKVVNMVEIGKLISSGALTGDEKLPKAMYDDESQKVTVVPNRNMIFLSIAAGRAISIGASNIGYAAHASDYSVYPDCRPEFIEALDKALVLGNLWDPIHLIAPFQHSTKSDIVKMGIELQAPLHLTWSCYAGNTRPCLECGTCLERTEAFLSNNKQDPALNDNEWKMAVAKYNIIKDSNASK